MRGAGADGPVVAGKHWLARIAQRDAKLFVLWQLGVKPDAAV